MEEALLAELKRIADALEAQDRFNWRWLAYNQERDAGKPELNEDAAKRTKRLQRGHIRAEREVQKSCEQLRLVETMKALAAVGRYDDILTLSGVDAALAELRAAGTIAPAEA